MRVDLDGAVEFRLQVEETADGIACDQADWVEAPDAQREWTGQELLEHGLPLAITDHPGAAVFTYRRVGDHR